MNSYRRRAKGLGLAAALLPCVVWAAGQGSASYRIEADVFEEASPAMAACAAHAQGSLSVEQAGVVGPIGSASYRIELGFQAATLGLDTDGDGLEDGSDPDADGDGVEDALDGLPYDTDNDGLGNFLDPDDDNDGHSDVVEALRTHTDPLNAADVLHLVRVVRAAPNSVVWWASEPGVEYWVDRAAVLTNEAAWVEIGGPVTGAGAGDETSLTHSNAPPTGFYRVRLP
jgi:hypothetical protein